MAKQFKEKRLEDEYRGRGTKALQENLTETDAGVLSCRFVHGKTAKNTETTLKQVKQFEFALFFNTISHFCL